MDGAKKCSTFADDLVMPASTVQAERESGKRPEQCPLLY